MKRLAVRAVVTASIGVLALTQSCSIPPPNDPSALTIGVVGDSSGLDPALHPSPLSFAAAREVMETLVDRVPGTPAIVPGIAQSWHVAPDGETWTFELRPGAKFSDGTPLDAAAVQANFDRWRNSNDLRHWSHDYPAYIERFGGVDAQSTIDNVYVVTPTEVGLHTRVPFGPLLDDLTLPAFSIGSPTAMSNDRQVYEDLPTGSGPYVFAEFAGDDHATLGLNAKSTSPAPAVAAIVLRDIPDPMTSLLALEKNDVDEVPALPPAAVVQAAGRADVRTIRWPSNATCFLAFFSDRAPFDNAMARRGVVQALDRKAIASSVDAAAAPASTWLPPGMLGYDAAAVPTAFDPAGARLTLARTQAPQTTITLYYPLEATTLLPDPKTTALEIARELTAVGLAVNAQAAQQPLGTPPQTGGALALGVVASETGDPVDLVAPLGAIWHDAGFATLVADGTASVDGEKRGDVYRNLDAYIASNAGAIPLLHPSEVAGTSARARVALNANVMPPGIEPSPAPR